MQQRLSEVAMAACQDEANLLYLGVANLWEIQIKSQRGRLKLELPLEQIVREQTQSDKFRLLSIEARHVLALDRLPTHYQDPFDRILIAQAQAEDSCLVIADEAIQKYAAHVNLLW
jgi:PIN domain nuclease of toxin-antitoxin system